MQVWMSVAEIKMIEKYLTPETMMLEYGSGGSTLYFSRLIKEYYSLEHNKKWFEKIKTKVSKQKNIKKYVLQEVDKAVSAHSEVVRATCWEDLEKSTSSEVYKKYIKYPATWDIKFDACLIDGRARPECAKFIYDFLKEGAYVFIHDYWLRKRYHVVEEKYNVVDHIKGGQSLVVLRKK